MQILLLVLILVVLVAGPFFAAGLATVIGAWFAVSYTIAWFIVACGLVLFIGIMAAAWTSDRWLAWRGFPKERLYEKYKRENVIEPGIWRDDMHYFVEIDGKRATGAKDDTHGCYKVFVESLSEPSQQTFDALQKLDRTTSAIWSFHKAG